MTADIAADGVGAGESTPTVVYPSGLLFGPRIEATFLPAGTLHPAVGVGATLIGTPRVDHYVDVPSYASIFPSSTLVYVEVWPGIQARLSNVIDVYARVPIDLLVAGEPVQEDRQTYTATLTPTTPTSDVTVAIGGQVGLQVRLFGKKPSTSMDDEP
jgi:hypothetical protein